MNSRYAAALIVATFVAELYLRPRGYNWRERTRGSTHTHIHTHTHTHTRKSPPVGDVLKGGGGRTTFYEAGFDMINAAEGGRLARAEYNLLFEKTFPEELIFYDKSVPGEHLYMYL